MTLGLGIHGRILIVNIPRSTYAAAANRLMLLTPLVFPGFAAVGMILAAVVGLPIAMMMRDLVSGDIGMALGIVSMIPFFVLPILLPTAAMVLIDRRIGIRCPNCSVSLTMRCMHEKVLITRKCSHCKATVLLDDEWKSTPGKSRPWLIAILVVLGFLGIVVAIALPMIAPNARRAYSKTELAEFGTFLGVVLLFGLIQAGITRILRRRWQREANADQSGR
jgi:hypothetical protein